MLTNLHVENYRMLRNTDLELGPLTLLIGPNGSGKSTILTLLDNLKNQQHLVSAENTPVDSKEQYKLRLIFTINMETVQFTANWTQNGGMLRMKAADSRNTSDAASANNIVIGFVHEIKRYEFDVRTMRQAVHVQTSQSLASNGSDLASFLDYIRDNNTERFEAIESDLARTTGLFDRIGFDRPQMGQKGFKLRLTNSQHFVPASSLSEGTILLVALFALAHQPTPPAIVCIEEPDRGIHPRLYPQVKEALLRLAFPKDFGENRPAVQVVATTHSPYFLDLFKDHPEFVTVCERDSEKGVRFRNLGSDPIAKDVLRDAVLGEAWFTGALGGVPAGS